MVFYVFYKPVPAFAGLLGFLDKYVKISLACIIFQANF